MPIIRDAVHSSTNKFGFGYFQVDAVDCSRARDFYNHKIRLGSESQNSRMLDADSIMAELALLRTISKKQRYKYKKDGIIPQQVLEVIRGWGIAYPGYKYGMGLSTNNFASKLHDYILEQHKLRIKTGDENLREIIEECILDARYLYEDTVKFELLPRVKRRRPR